MKYILIALICLTWACSDSCANKTQETIKDASCKDTCAKSFGNFDNNSCQLRCESYSPKDQFKRADGTVDEKKLVTHCQGVCEEKQKWFLARRTNSCAKQCLFDRDQDNVYDTHDRCPNSSKGATVASDGCLDSDGDGLSDGVDQCPQQGGPDLDLNGCPAQTPTCKTGYCAFDDPVPCKNDDCDREQETPLLTMIPEQRRIDLAKQILSIRPSRTQCPDAKNSINSPVMRKPHQGLSHQKLNRLNPEANVYFTVKDNKLVPVEDDDSATVVTPNKGKHQIEPILVEFSSVEVPCPPARYTLYVEYYFCDNLPQVDEKAHYHELGFCKWLPLDYVSGVQPDTEFFYPLNLGALFAKLYQPHFQKPEMASKWQPDPNSGKISFNFRTLWLNFQVIAHDANGRNSSIGMHQPSSYRALFQFEKAKRLRKIPSEAHAH